MSLLSIWWPRVEGVKAALVELSDLFGFDPHNPKKSAEMVKNRQGRLPNSWVFLPARLIGQGEYHRDWRWSWVGCLFCWALAKQSRVVLDRNTKTDLEDRAKWHFRPYIDAYKKYNTIHEVYDNHGEPISIALYRSEKCFSEGIGTYLRARCEIFGSDCENKYMSL